MARGFYPGQRGHKKDRENVRAERRARKAERLAQRRAEKNALEQFDNGTFPIDDLPFEAQGVFRTLSRQLPSGETK